MKNFPIYSQGVCLSVVQCFQKSNVWYLRFCRDERVGPTYSLAEIAAMLAANKPEDGMLLAQLGYVAKSVEEYTDCPILNLPYPRRTMMAFARHEQRNPFLNMIRVSEDSPWIASFMLEWYTQGRIKFENVPTESRFLFVLEDTDEAKASITVKGSSTMLYCAVENGHSEIENVNATFCRFSHAKIEHQGIHNAFIFGHEGEQFVCQ